MIQTIYVPDVWKDLKLEFKEDNSNIKLESSLYHIIKNTFF